jgi:peptidoglycan/xylan/chitin deacetylase (PgdA/CDA1 family)
MAADSVLNICFHGIGTPRRELEPGEDNYWLEPDRLPRILDEIAVWPAVQISFDDGNESDARIALPALLERGLSAQFFVVANRLGAKGSLSIDDVHELTANGMTVGTHGMTHRPWRGMTTEEREVELVEARRRIEDAVGMTVTEAACPQGRYDRQVLADLRRHGYRRVYTSDRREARRGSWLQARFSLGREDTPESIRANILTRPGLAQRTQRSVKGRIKRLL